MFSQKIYANYKWKDHICMLADQPDIANSSYAIKFNSKIIFINCFLSQMKVLAFEIFVNLSLLVRYM